MKIQKLILIILILLFTTLVALMTFANNPHSEKAHATKDWSSYINFRSEAKPRALFQKVLKGYFAKTNDSLIRRAVNFGSGSGKEDIQLVKMGWEVLGVDSCLLSSQIIQEQTKIYQGKYVSFVGSFEKAKLAGTYDLIMSFYSLPFMQKQHLEDLLQTINIHLKEEGVFVVNFLGLNHEFVKKEKAFGLSQKELFLLMLNNGFEIIEFNNKVYKAKSFTSKEKLINWDVLEVVARKKGALKIYGAQKLDY